ncbi:hypothetical protein PAECIP111892_03610 [Paenibacillus auburnensis]|uniref:Reverse transcriptase domain-containing protein n=1 Tax=Paenibacillus auburnensis TaxID=2905649 RepID=A0ABM9CG92_9BACL|nr:reverse transcriptase domain-containing protein [Paenibacillus auburnensis]CAH1211623.1 hypothetical protein PAECIP111892_03610 [Paenibacillus auburnensis]
MSASKLFTRKFQVKNIKKNYFEKIVYKCTPGIDKINRTSFENRIDEYVTIISMKALNGNYKFIPYKEKLISKGYDKPPRQISIPTIRDKVTLSLLNEFLSKVFENNINNKIIQTLVNELKQSILSGHFDYFIKIDIKNFFPSIPHDKLMKLIRKKIRKKEILTLIEDSLKTPTIPFPTKIHSPNTVGIPQGISISSILANIYLSDIDNSFSVSNTDFKYFRYVDDILILCKNTNVTYIKNDILTKLKNLDLETSPNKYKEAEISEGFSYLGYFYKEIGNEFGFSVRDESIKRFEESIIKIFSEYKFNNKNGTEKFIWKLNKKITGCVFEHKKYGWLFFYSQIDDQKLLYHLDWFIQKLCKQIDLDSNVKKRIKRFVRTYHEIVFNLKNTNYIPNFDDFDLDAQRSVLRDVFDVRDVLKLTENEVSKKFKKNIFKFIKELEKDVQNIS